MWAVLGAIVRGKFPRRVQMTWDPCRARRVFSFFELFRFPSVGYLLAKASGLL